MCAVMFCTGNVQASSAAYYDSGRSGDSWEDAYIINSAEDLVTLKDRVNSSVEPEGKYYVLGADIDLTSYTDWEGIGVSNAFTGHFDGQNHTVTLNIDSENLDAGLFYSIATNEDEIAVRNLNISGTIKGHWVGALSWGLDSGIIENCSFTGTIEAYGEWAGGLVDLMNGGTIRNCRVNAKISGNEYAGGIAGEVEGGNIQNCTVEDSTRISAQQVGGIAGYVNYNFPGNISGNHWPSTYPESGNDYTPQPQSDDVQPVIITEWNGHTYQLFTENLTWEQAKAHCESLGGHLATITSQAEQNFIASTLTNSQGSYWLGGYADASGWWHWVTDEPFEKQYQNFAEGQPNGAGRYLMILNGGRWDDVRTDENASGFICEKEDTPAQVIAAPLAPAFLRWLATSRDAQQDDSGYLNGTIPSPIDMSHLNNNLPRISAAGYAFRAAELAAKFDGREAFGLPEARNQGKGTNTCWAFASIAAMEANYLAQKFTSLNGTPDFSELQVVWSVKSRDLSESILLDMGTQDDAIHVLLQSTYAPISESVFPYSSDATNESISADWHSKTFVKLPVTLVDTQARNNITEGNRDLIKQDIVNNGGVFCKIRYEKAAYSETNHSYYLKSDAIPNHAVFIAGWDDNYSADMFVNTPPVNGAWLVRNSRGADWGDKGYFWLSYAQGTNSDRNIIDATVFIVSEDKISQSGKEKHEHDEKGKTRAINSAWSSNVFRSGRDEDLVQITFPTTDNNAEYKVFVNTFGKIKPSYPGEADTPLMSGVFSSAGDHTLTLQNRIHLYSGDYYAIIVKITHTSDYDSTTAVEGRIDGYVSPDVREGNSFFAAGEPVPSDWQDGKDIDGGPYNACIKTITVPRKSQETAPQITTLSLPAASKDADYVYQLTASGTDPIEWRCGNIPSGMALSRQGVLSGTPDTAGEFDLKITAYNNVDSVTSTLKLNVAGTTDTDTDTDHDTDHDTDSDHDTDTDSDHDTDTDTDHDTDTDTDHEPKPLSRDIVGSSGSGCNSGVNMMMLIFAAMVFMRAGSR